MFSEFEMTETPLDPRPVVPGLQADGFIQRRDRLGEAGPTASSRVGRSQQIVIACTARRDGCRFLYRVRCGDRVAESRQVTSTIEPQGLRGTQPRNRTSAIQQRQGIAKRRGIVGRGLHAGGGQKHEQFAGVFRQLLTFAGRQVRPILRLKPCCSLKDAVEIQGLFAHGHAFGHVILERHDRVYQTECAHGPGFKMCTSIAILNCGELSPCGGQVRSG